MKTIRIHRHPDCVRCARIARVHQAFDWLGRIESTTEAPRSGPLRLGQIVVEDRRTGALHEGTSAFDLICRQVPLYAPFRALLFVPAFRRHIEREMSGCADGACAVPAAREASAEPRGVTG